MEYGEGGSLYQNIQKRKTMKKKFSEDEIFNYAAQMSISLLMLHSKNIIHRNFSSENIFIKNGVLKLNNLVMFTDGENSSDKRREGSLDIWPPEKWMKFKYCQKADIWAFGVILYELIYLQKPFEGPNLEEYEDEIIYKQLAPLKDEWSEDMQTLLNNLLKRNVDLRASIYEVVSMPKIRKYIDLFVRENGCSNEVTDFLPNIMVNPQDQAADMDTNIPPKESQIKISEISLPELKKPEMKSSQSLKKTPYFFLNVEDFDS